jgi:hypothetical protein
MGPFSARLIETDTYILTIYGLYYEAVIISGYVASTGGLGNYELGRMGKEAVVAYARGYCGIWLEGDMGKHVRNMNNWFLDRDLNPGYEVRVLTSRARRSVFF